MHLKLQSVKKWSFSLEWDELTGVKVYPHTSYHSDARHGTQLTQHKQHSLTFGWRHQIAIGAKNVRVRLNIGFYSKSIKASPSVYRHVGNILVLGKGIIGHESVITHGFITRMNWAPAFSIPQLQPERIQVTLNLQNNFMRFSNLSIFVQLLVKPNLYWKLGYMYHCYYT